MGLVRSHNDWPLIAASHHADHASCSCSMSIFFIVSIACNTRCDLAPSGSASSLPNAVGMICHDRPNLSFSQPQRSFDPPSDSFSHSSSTSCCVSQLTKSEIAGVNEYIGPPFKAMNSCPSSVNVTDMTLPLPPEPPPEWVTRPTSEFLKTDT